jgi:3D (Asp-Asp-Asp) domain-containing protein
LSCIHNVGTGLLANDTGKDIQGYRLDLYRGAGVAVCSGYNNPMGVSACTPAQKACPTSELK